MPTRFHYGIFRCMSIPTSFGKGNSRWSNLATNEVVHCTAWRRNWILPNEAGCSASFGKLWSHEEQCLLKINKIVCGKCKQMLVSVSTAKFPILGSSCLSQVLSKYLYSKIFQTQLEGTERRETSMRTSLKVKSMVYYCSEWHNFCHRHKCVLWVWFCDDLALQ